MQGGFIGGFKENLKALKQEIKGADVFDGPVKLNKSVINKKEFIIGSSIYTKEFIIKTKIYNKEFGMKTKINTLTKASFNAHVRNYVFGMEVGIKNHNFVKPETLCLKKDLEKFITVTKAKPIELTKKAKVKNAYIDKFRVKTFEGTNKIRQIPAIVEGRRFLSNKELIDLAIKVKTEKKDLDFTKYNFKAVFEKLPYDFIEDFQYLDDSVQLKLYYKKYSREISMRKSLVILVEKNSLTTEKIFV